MELWGINSSTLWFAIGFFMLAAELLSTGFVFFFLGIGGLLTGLILLGFDLSLSNQIVLFVIGSFLSLLGLRKPIQKRFNQSKDGDFNAVEGETASVTQWDTNSHTGTVKFKGADWQANATSSEAFKPGESVKITKVDGIRLQIEKQQ